MDVWPEGIALATSSRAWIFPEARVIFTKSFGQEATLEDANGLVDFFLWLETMEGPDAMPRTPPPIVVHDWRSFARVPTETRRTFIRRRAEIKTMPAKLVLALSVDPVLRMALRTVALASQLVTRAVKLELVDDPVDALEGAGVTAPDALLHLRLRDAWGARAEGPPRKTARPPA